MSHATRRRGGIPALCAALFLVAILSSSAAATDRTWVGGTGGSWYLNTNWNPTGSPDPADALTIDSGSGDSGAGSIAVRGGGSLTVLNSGVSVTTPQLWIADWGAGSLSIRNGALVSSWDTLICGFSGTTGTAEVTGGSSLQTYSLTIGASGTGTFTLSGGGHASSEGATYLGTQPSATGIISMTGYGTSLGVGGYLVVGEAGTGTLEVFSGANVSSEVLIVANLAGSMGTVNVDGANAHVDGGTCLYVGNAGYGGLIVQNGSHVTAETCCLGCWSVGRGEARVEGVDSLLEVGSLAVGGTDANTATLDILDYGEVRVGGATTVRAKGVINLAGGKLMTDSLAGTGRLHFTAGTLQVTAGDLTFGYNRPLGPAVTLNPGDLIDVSAAATLDLGASVAVAGGRLQADTVTNYAALDVRSGGSVIADTQVYNAAALYLDNGSISAPAGIVNDYGAMLIARGAVSGPLANFGQTFVTGTLSVSGAVTSFGSILATNQPDTPLLRCGSLDNYGLIDLAGRYGSGQEWVTVPGAITTITPAAAVTNQAGGVIRGCSSIGGRLTNSGGLVYADLPGTLLIRELTANTLGGELRIADGATMSILTAFDNEGEINLEGPNAVLAGASIANSGTLHGQGRVGNPIANSGSIRADAGILRLGGSLTSAGGSLIEAMDGATVFVTQGLADNQGGIILRNGTFDNNSRTMVNNGTLTGCGTLRTGGLTNNAGGTLGVGGGDLDVIGTVRTDGIVFTQADCTTTFYSSVNGAGSFPGVGTVVFLGGYSPGGSPAAVPFEGNLTLASTASLEIELGGTAPGIGHDRVSVGHTLTLGGTMNVSLWNGFRPAHNDTFRVLEWGTRAGSLSAMTGLDLGERLRLVPVWNADNLELQAVQGGSGAWRFDVSGLASVSANWTGAIPNGLGDTATFGPVIQAPRQVTVDAATVLTAMVFDSAKAYTVTGPGTVTLQAGGDPATISVTGASGAAHHVIGAPLTLLSPLQIDNQSAGDLAFTAPLNDVAGWAITKTGGGAVTFEGPLTFGVGSLLMICDGTVNLNSDAGSDLASNLSISITGAELYLGSSQHLDTLEIGDGGKVVFAGAQTVAVKHLVMGGMDLGATTLTPEPATLALLALGGMATLLRRWRK